MPITARNGMIAEVVVEGYVDRAGHMSAQVGGAAVGSGQLPADVISTSERVLMPRSLLYGLPVRRSRSATPPPRQ